MSSILSKIGLRAASGERPPNFVAGFLVANWTLAYLIMSTRTSKMYYGLDHNAAPREDLSKYGEAAVKAGKISQRTLDKLKRQEAAYANAVEGYPLFVASMLLSVIAGVRHETINTIGVWYTLSRVAFSLCYSHIESEGLSFLRSAAWWSGNISCITGLVLAGKKL